MGILDPNSHLSEHDFNFIKKFAADRTGITIDASQQQMVKSRISKRIRALGMCSYREYVAYLKKDRSGTELEQLINALSTNMTSFFRQSAHFDFLKQDCEEKFSTDTIYVWSAACSKGHEVYTLAFVFEEIKSRYPAFNYRILGTDIDTECLNTATAGIYEKDELQVLPKHLETKYLKHHDRLNPDQRQVVPSIRKNIRFLQHNLIEYSTYEIDFHYIFLRNVMIYFRNADISRVVSKMERHLRSSGYLFIGSSETLNDISSKLQPVAPAIYQKNY